MHTGRVFSEAHLICVDRDGRERFATQRNLGWNAARECYVSQFVVESEAHYALFCCRKHSDSICPDPAQRLAFDLAFMEERLGLFLVDAEPVDLA